MMSLKIKIKRRCQFITVTSNYTLGVKKHYLGSGACGTWKRGKNVKKSFHFSNFTTRHCLGRFET